MVAIELDVISTTVNLSIKKGRMDDQEGVDKHFIESVPGWNLGEYQWGDDRWMRYKVFR